MDDNTWLAAFARPFANNRKKLMTLPVAVLFVISFALLGLTCYGAQPAYHPPGLSHFWDSSYLALSRSAWCMGLLILCFLLFQGYGGPIISLLDNPACAVLSRLTFAAYLIHPALINMVFADGTLPAHYSPIWVSFNFLGILTAVFLFSAVGFLLVEKPCANLERVLMGGGGKGKKEK
jgi:peptidoglycan/LPS O-acetylase OafA/YrhL